jgi:hypothetical protein
MAFTSKLATPDSNLVGSTMTAGQLEAANLNESVSHTMSMGHTVNVQQVYGLQGAMSFVHVASFDKAPSPANIPLVIIDGKVQQNGSLLDLGGRTTRFIGANYTQVAEDQVLIATAALTITLLPASQFAYRKLDIKSRAAGTVIVDADGAEIIDDDVTKQLTIINESLTLLSDGLQWFTIGGGGAGSTNFLTITNTDFADALNYYYGGTNSGGAWVINRYDKPGGANKATANEGNNPSHPTLASAWSVRTSLTYV